jgi:quercetin dioxygenase-like cupin family protein
MIFREFKEGYRWADTDLLAYKADGSAPFKAVTRQVLFADPNMAAELRYFEVAQGGHSTLERHQHVHAVMILRGGGCCLIGDKVWALAPNDLVSIPSMTWHQFRAALDRPLGFLCMVNAERDRPQLPTESDLERLRAIPDVATFIRVTQE